MRALLAYVALQPAREHSREALADLLWSGTDPVTARGNLRRTLSDLRRVLATPSGEPVLEADRRGVRFVADAFVDALVFASDQGSPAAPDGSTLQHDETLASLYRGEFLAGLHLAGNAAFDDWLQQQREHLHRRALGLLARLADAHERDGAFDRALQVALRQLELDPWDEASHRRVMRLHGACGRREAALAQFEACRRLLARELGTPPSAQTIALAERLREDGPAAAPTVTTPRPPRDERRWVTVVSCELSAPGVDDPDDAAERLRLPQARCADLVRRFAGHLVPMQGGGLLAYFGYPQAREDSALQGVRAALAAAATSSDAVGVRCGVHTGLILSGGDPLQPDPVGRTTAVAIALRRRVGRGAAALSGETRRLVAGWFDCTALPLAAGDDADAAGDAYRIDGERAVGSRLDASERLTPLVGRGDELALLATLWEDTVRGGRQALMLQGEAGIGKSRVLRAFQQRLAGEPHEVRLLRCSPDHGHSPFFPVLSMIEAALARSAGEAPDTWAAKLERHAATFPPGLAADARVTLLRLFALRETDALAASSSASSRARTLDVLRAMLGGDGSGPPVLLLVEDVHWADPSTLELLGSLLDRPGPTRCLLLLTARPGWMPPFALPVRTLGPLDADTMRQLVVSHVEGLAPAQVHDIVARADGVPLFAEALAQAAVQPGGTGIPGTLRDLLSSRLDRLGDGDARQLAQAAATIGRRFDLDLLSRVVAVGEAMQDRSLARLEDAGLVTRVDDTGWQFGHALIQEAAYESQSRADRREAHRRIGLALHGEFADRVAAAPEIVARHLTQGGEARLAIDYWTRAGLRAVRAGANREAIAQFDAGRALLATLAAAPDTAALEYALLTGLGAALHAIHGYGSPQATEIGARLAVLRDAGGAGLDPFLAEWTRLRNAVATTGPRGIPEAAMALAGALQDDPVREQAAHYVAAIASFWLGELQASRDHALRAIALHRSEHGTALLAAFGEDLSVSYAGHLSWALCLLGFGDQAQAVCDRMLAQAREAGHPKTLAMALLFASMLMRWADAPARAVAVTQEAIALTTQHGMTYWRETSESLNAWARAMVLGGDDATAFLDRAAHLGAAPPSYQTLRWLGMAEVLIGAGRHDEALAFLAQAREGERSSGSGQFTPERHRLIGLCLQHRSTADAAGAEAAFTRAMVAARRQGARILELRAARCLAKLWQGQGRADDARQLLARLYAGFTEGFGTPDLVAAADLLRALAAD